MGIGDWFKKTFGKQVCAFCGAEVGMLKRSKIKNDEFICNDCARGCSRYIQKYRFTKEEILGHMEYMKRQGKLYEQLAGKYTRVIPSASYRDAIEFYDDFGMLRIRHRDGDDHYPKELFRYDQIASYEPYLEESEPDEPGKPKEFGECGLDITLVGGDTQIDPSRKGLRAHPYITQTIRVCINNRDKHQGQLELDQIITRLNHIFGVYDDTTGLFNRGPTVQQRRQAQATTAMMGVFGAAIQAAKTGQVSEEAAAQVADAMNKVDDANTSGLAKYSRLADAAEGMIGE